MPSLPLLYIVLLLPLLCFASDDPSITFEELYLWGKNEYTAGNWPDCVAYMRKAIEDFRYLEDESADCRKKCTTQVEKGGESRLSRMHEISEKALCILRCKRDRFTERRPHLRKMANYYDFQERKPYEYLHICYWNRKMLDKAVSAAYTFLVKNPDHERVLEGLTFYMKQPGYKEEMLVDELRSEYEKRFIGAVAAYDEESWGVCVDEMEASLQKLMMEDEKCRFVCEDKLDWSSVDANPEIDVLFTSMYASILRCQHNCLYKLTMVNGHKIGDSPIAAHYEYLRFCQYKLKRGSDAARSVASYLLFDRNPLMLRNKYVYTKEFNRPDLFTPYPEMVVIYNQRKLEERYLTFVEESFRYVNNEFPPEKRDDYKKFDEEVDIEDKFDYNAVRTLLSPEECRHLRSPFSSHTVDSLVSELTRRVSVLFPSISAPPLIHCASSIQQASCAKPFILSLDSGDCGEWLGEWYTGCSITYCT
ncbi:hypothetical protein WR25_10631 [Diploscapter pachys]|uniref:Leprecan-like alpha-helical domain-containing protein n=1 Tax=Diploscapter pachys TaxID=2018661 RepID=A0A2A2KZY7_9BILA|nr:hypothetical protein WR25_10631 [Diploscapter pachys]